MPAQRHRCNEHELGQTLRDGDGQGGLLCCSPWGCKELDTTGNKFYASVYIYIYIYIYIYVCLNIHTFSDIFAAAAKSIYIYMLQVIQILKHLNLPVRMFVILELSLGILF